MDFLFPLEGDIQGDTHAMMKDVRFLSEKVMLNVFGWGGLQWEYIYIYKPNKNM